MKKNLSFYDQENEYETKSISKNKATTKTKIRKNFVHYYFSIDATNVRSVARMVNDSPEEKANSKMKRYVNDGVAHIGLFAKCKIELGEELRYG